MKWSDLSVGFCEGIVSGPPEYVNAFTSLALTFYGLMGLFLTRNHNILIRITSAMLSVTGVGSFVYHWTWYQGWGQIDGLPMLISSYLGAYQILDIIIYKLFTLNRNNKWLYEKISGILSIILMGMLIISLALSVSDDTSHWFTILFAVPELIILVGVLLTKKIMDNDNNKNKDNTSDAVNDKQQLLHAYKISHIGLITAITAAIIWCVTEILCPANIWMRFLYAHGVWHISISAGMYMLMQFMIFIYSYNKGKQPYFIRGITWYGKLFYNLVPIVELKSPDSEKSLLNNNYTNNNNFNFYIINIDKL